MQLCEEYSPSLDEAHQGPPLPVYVAVDWLLARSHLAPTSAVTAPPLPIFRTSTLPSDWVMPAEQLYATATAAPTPLWVPPPPVLAANPWSRWWQGILIALPFIAYLVMRNTASWGEGLSLINRLTLAMASVIVIWLMATQLPYWNWSQQRGPVGIVLVLIVCAFGSGLVVGPADYLQGQQAEQYGDYAAAWQFYRQHGNVDDRARVQIAWGRALTDTNNQFTAALAHIQTALATTQGTRHEDARAAFGHLQWRWGQSLFAVHDFAGARQHWQLAQQQAEGTSDGDRAAAALAAPQTITGRITWKGEPLPGVQVALVSGWKYSASLHLLQTEGDRYTAISGVDGTFSIAGVKPGMRYAVIWQGGFGDTTSVTADGTPVYIVTVQSLEGTAVGPIVVAPNTAGARS